MPLVRVEVRNEYALGAPELYREADKEDPKEILDGVAVAGLVGLLRQLGDLAEFAAEVFHGLQEEVGVTFSRSHKLMARVQRIEAAVPPLEKAVLAQRSHLHFAYTAGSNWHTSIRCQQTHFVYGDVPHFIADSYEDSRGPPRLHLLDRFDTGGPGSCLKRYSDPTFFRRASVASGEASSMKFLKDKKGRKIKKRSSWTRNREVSGGASLSNHSGRMQFTELSVGELTSPTQTTFTDDATLKSDLCVQSNLGLRNRSGYMEGDFRPSYSTQPEEQESRVSIMSTLKRHDSDFLDYDFLREKVVDVYDDIHVNQSQEQAGCSSSSVTWDEKAETIEPTTSDINHDDRQEDAHKITLETLSRKFDTETMGNDDVKSDAVTKMDIQSGDIHLQDGESETDHFLDALNTIDTEPEADIEQEVENYSMLEENTVDDGQPDLTRDYSELPSLNSESNVLSSDSLINGGCENNPLPVTPESPYATYNSISGKAAKNELNSVSPVDEALLSAQRVKESFSPLSADFHEDDKIVDGTNVEPDTSTAPFNFRDDISGIPIIERTRSSSESLKPAPKTNNVVSGMFWTNGGLLGLQPSKPLDWSRSNSLPQDHMFTKDENVSSSSKNAGISYGSKNSSNFEENSNMDSSTCQEDQESGTLFRKPTWKISPSDLDVKLGKPGVSFHQNNVSFSGLSGPANSELGDAIKQEENCSSSRMFELGNRLLTNGSNKKPLPGRYTNENALWQKNCQNEYQTTSGRTKDVFGVESLILSPSSSPPLEHMKLLLQPIDGFKTSKLKLKFSDGDTTRESCRNIFPSFQLVPEMFIAQHSVGSDSDDDTFCRSSPCSADDCHSRQSDSNSEQWESGESPKSKDQSLYDALQRISLTESVSTVQENGDMHHNCGIQFPFVENSVQNSHSCHSFDLQSLNTANQSFREELGNNNNIKDLLEPQIAPTHAPPPLPPVQWRGMKSHLDVIEDMCKTMPEGSKYGSDVKHSESTIKIKPAPLNHEQNFETTNLQKSKIFSSQKSNGPGETNKGKSVNEMGDFLRQIRAKSFNLRPIMTEKPNVSSNDTANVQVTAILEKANAIRQAIGSDDGSNWSDT